MDSIETAATDPHRSLIADYTPQPPPPPPLSSTTASASNSFRYTSSPDYNHYQQIIKSRILSRILSVLIIAVCLSFFVFFVLWIVFKPRTPDFAIDSAFISPMNSSACSNCNSTYAKMNLSFEVDNPNYNIEIHYRRMRVKVMYGEYVVGKTSLPGFQQKGDRNVVALRAVLNLTTTAMYSASNVIGTGLRDLEFDVRVLGLIRFEMGRLDTSWRRIKVLCEGVKFGALVTQTSVPRNISTNGGRIACDVG